MVHFRGFRGILEHTVHVLINDGSRKNQVPYDTIQTDCPFKNLPFCRVIFYVSSHKKANKHVALLMEVTLAAKNVSSALLSVRQDGNAACLGRAKQVSHTVDVVITTLGTRIPEFSFIVFSNFEGITTCNCIILIYMDIVSILR